MSYSWLALAAMLFSPVVNAIDGNSFPRTKSTVEQRHDRLTAVGKRALGLTALPELKITLTEAHPGNTANSKDFYFPTAQLMVTRLGLFAQTQSQYDPKTGVAVIDHGNATTIGYDWLGWDGNDGPKSTSVREYGFFEAAGDVYEAAGSPIGKKQYYYQLLVCLRQGPLPFTGLTQVVRCQQLKLDAVLAQIKQGESIRFTIENPNHQGEQGSFLIEPLR